MNDVASAPPPAYYPPKPSGGHYGYSPLPRDPGPSGYSQAPNYPAVSPYAPAPPVLQQQQSTNVCMQ